MAGNAQVAARMKRAAKLMQEHGLTVGAFAGWEQAGRSSTMNPRAVLAHHTAAIVDIDRVLRDGRPDLAGPLCNWALHRDGTWMLVASGRANHAGEGVLPSSESYGIEATGPIPIDNTGQDAFPQYRAYVIGVGCILLAEGWASSTVFGHRETARPCGRKPDPAFGGVTLANCVSSSMNTFRGDVAAFLRDGGSVDMEVTSFSEDAKKTLEAAATKGSQNTLRTAVGTGPDDPAGDYFSNLASTLKRVEGKLDGLLNSTPDSPGTGDIDIDALTFALVNNLSQNTEFLNAVAREVASEESRRLAG